MVLSEAVSSTSSPAQVVPSSLVVPDISVAAMEAVGGVFTVIVVDAEAVQPLASVTVTVYVVVVEGEYVMEGPISTVVLHS